MRFRFLLATAAATILATSAYAQGTDIKIGVLNDRSGTYADLSGEGSNTTVRLLKSAMYSAAVERCTPSRRAISALVSPSG